MENFEKNNYESSALTALRNSLIFQEISSLLSFSDLKNFRVVHSVCNEVALPLIYKKVKQMSLCVEYDWIKLNYRMAYPRYFESDSEAVRYSQKLADSGYKKDFFLEAVKNVTKVARKSSNLPCTEFVIKLDVFDNIPKNRLQENFFNALSTFVTKLEVVTRSYHRLCFQKTPVIKTEFLSLTTLKITNSGSQSSERQSLAWKRGLFYFGMVIKHAPALETLAIESQTDPRFVVQFLAAVARDQWLKIKNLTMCGRIETDHIEQLTLVELRLEVLSLKFKSSTSLLAFPDDVTLHTFLEKQCETLKEMNILVKPVMTNFVIRLPNLSKVQRLKIDIVDNFLDVKFPDISFVQNFPCLNQLILLRNYDNLTELFHDKMEPLKTVTVLEIPDHPLDPEMVKKAARIFPMIRKLTIFGQMELLQNVNYMKNVKELIISGQTVTDVVQAVTGYTRKELNRSRILLKDIKLIVPKERDPVAIFDKIHVLRLQNVCVTQLMCTHGLVKLKSLKHLDLWECTKSANTMLPENTIAHMRKKFTIRIQKECIISGTT